MIWRRAVQALEIDVHQWRVLTWTLLKLDFRVGGFGGRAFGDAAGSAWQQAVMTLLVYIAMGIGFALVAALIGDVFLSGVIVLTGVMFVVGSILLIDYQSVITSPDDYHILAFQPISSRTYFAVRMTNVFVYAGVPMTVIAGPVAVSYALFARGVDPALGVAAVGAVYGVGLMTTLAIVVLYAFVLRVMSADRLARSLSYLQLVMGFAVYGGYLAAGSMIDREALQAMTLDHHGWVLLHPASWFASYLELASGRTGTAEVGPAVVSIAALVLLGRAAAGRVSLEYSERLGALLSTAAPCASPTQAGRGPFGSLRRRFPRGETRAVALLVRAQFKYDQKFRLAVLGIIPMTAIFLITSVRDGAMIDPFVSTESAGPSGNPLLAMAVLLFPVLLKTTLVRSDAYRASWLFYASPADHSRIVMAMNRVVAAYFVVPYLGLMAAIFSYYFGHPGHAVVHVVTLALLSYAFLQTASLFQPDLPFSQPPRKGEQSSVMFRLTFFLVLTSTIGTFIIERLIYPSAVLTSAMLVSLAACSLGLDRLVAARVRRVSARWEYID